MRSVDVRVVHEHGDNSLAMSLVQDRQPVETFGTNGAHEPLRHTIRLQGTKRRANNLEASPSKYLVKTVAELLVPVANQEAEFSGRSANVQVSWRACCVTQGAVGFAV